MKDDWEPVKHCVIFPIAPIAVIYLIATLCRDIWRESYYTPGEDGGEVAPTLALFMVPMLLIIVACLLAGLTMLNRWVSRRFAPRLWWRVSTAIPRIALAGGSLVLYMAAAAFLMGDELGVFRHWQVACAWAACAVSVIAFVAQQYTRIAK